MTVEIIMPNQINKFLMADPDGKKFMFILDEYFEMIDKASMSPLISGKIPGLFTVGTNHRTILSTGHHSDALKNFLL